MLKYMKIKDKELVCTKCDKTFKCTRKRYYTYKRKLKKGLLKDCYCDDCRPKRLSINTCVTCGKLTKNPKFCSRSCSNSFNSKKNPKRKPIKRICSCGVTFIPGFKESRLLCSSCRTKKKENKHITLKEYNLKLSIKGKHPSWKNSHIRQLNRSWNKDMLEKGCIICGYLTHVELCHIKPITEFSEDTTISEINSPNNVVPMCPNHHWEFDHGLIKLPDNDTN